MNSPWTFSRKLAAAFAVLSLVSAIIVLAAIATVRSVSEAKDEVLDRFAQNRVDAERLHALSANKAADSRAYMLTGDAAELQRIAPTRKDFQQTLDQLRARVVTDDSKQMLNAIAQAEQEHQAALEPIMAQVGGSTPVEQLADRYEQTVRPLRLKLDDLITRFVEREEQILKQHRAAADDRAARGIGLLIGLAVTLGALALGASMLLGRALSRQISDAVQKVRSSSAELQTSATQQATGAREQATAMQEISTTISEMLASSRQIAESAQRVAHIAGETALAARAGNDSVERTQEAVTAIRRQTDLIVGHMGDLGKKSQQIGGILEIINELSDQTNILAINATIEAAGAGEVGRRFAVVAEEIRKLADRVGGSTKDIRRLIDEIRASVNTTVMATEGGSKAVEAGARQVGELASAFRHIGDLVRTTTQAASEIELSTKQQTTAVEQVNLAIGGVAQATREAETSSGQSAQTASVLADMSRKLSQIVRAEPGV